ncbi:hypothetical protein ACO1O0_003768 [Amphichorda felina]
MAVAAFLRRSLSLLVPLAVACTVYLYLYPAFNGCAFPLPSRDPKEAFEEAKKLHWPYYEREGSDSSIEHLAPFRLLALGDPQLEGDTSIPTEVYGYLPHLKSIVKHLIFRTEHSSFRERIRMTLHDTVDLYFEDIPNILESVRKRFDLFGNDFYLAHIYRTMHWWTQPTHVTVLGDLVGSQWIDDEEFEKRGRRYWNRTFKGGERLPDDLAQYPSDEYDISGILDGSPGEEIWAKRILNVAGNHDIGYAGDLTEERMERFERVFGKANYELRFELPVSDPELNATIIDDDTNPDSRRLQPELRIVVLNDMNLDTPAYSSVLQDATYSFINSVISHSHGVEYKGAFTIVLTHIPTYKPEGVCVDGPFFDFHPSAEGGGVKEQYLLSADASKGFFEGIFGVSANTAAPGNGHGRPGLILNGHDHAGCDTYHFVNHTNGTGPEDRSWEHKLWKHAQAQELPSNLGLPGRREITVRSMMGDFSGNAGLLSLWFDFESWEWKYEYADCRLGRHHFWWLTHILDFSILVVVVTLVAVMTMEANGVDVDGLLSQLVPWVPGRLQEMKQRSTKTSAIGKGNVKA